MRVQRETDPNGYLLERWGILTAIAVPENRRDLIAFLERECRGNALLALRHEYSVKGAFWTFTPLIGAPSRVVVFRQDSAKGRAAAEKLADELRECFNHPNQDWFASRYPCDDVVDD